VKLPENAQDSSTICTAIWKLQ